MLLLRNIFRGRRTFASGDLPRHSCSSAPNGPNGRAESLLDNIAKIFRETIVPNRAIFASAVTAGLMYYTQIRPITTQIKEDVINVCDWSGLLPSAIEESTIPADVLCKLPEDKYVKRSALEADITRAETSDLDNRYTIVYGPKGVGKSSLVYHVAGERKGVVLLNVTSKHDKASLTRHLVKILLGPRAECQDIDESKLAGVIRRSTSNPVTIIFDVERSTTDGMNECLMAVRGLAKSLTDSSRCVIVLSEANAVVEFGRDPRENFVFVGELSADEARELLRKKQCTLSDEAMKEVFDKVGTSPALLKELMYHLGSNANYQAFIAKKLVKAEGDLAEFPLKPILKALKE